MTYAETLHFLYHSLPVFQHIGGNAYKPGFGNITELEKELGEPHRRFRSVHVAGTNGKGSVSHMTAAVLQAAGYRTGLFTSPHLKDFRERIRVNGEMISEEAVVAFVSSHREAIDRIRPSFFEITTAIAFDHFARERVDIAVTMEDTIILTEIGTPMNSSTPKTTNKMIVVSTIFIFSLLILLLCFR